jgi:hypothetical protein
LGGEPRLWDGIGAWSPKGEFLGYVNSGTSETCGGSGETSGGDYLQVSRGTEESGTSVTLHRFVRGGEEGYRARVRRWNEEGERSYWIAPTVEDEGYIGMFTEEEARRVFPYLFAAREMPGGFEIG